MKNRPKRFASGPKTTYPWSRREPIPVGRVRAWKEKRQGGEVFYEQHSDGSVRRPEHERHERSVLELSPRRHRREKKRLKREEAEFGG